MDSLGAPPSYFPRIYFKCHNTVQPIVYVSNSVYNFTDLHQVIKLNTNVTVQKRGNISRLRNNLNFRKVELLSSSYLKTTDITFRIKFKKRLFG